MKYEKGKLLIQKARFVSWNEYADEEREGYFFTYNVPKYKPCRFFVYKDYRWRIADLASSFTGSGPRTPHRGCYSLRGLTPALKKIIRRKL